jgi:RNA polymerase sigma factor (TIGR02999 family)
MSEVSQILNAIAAGDPHAARQLLPLVYDELRRQPAAQKLAHEAPGQTLEATALVHEAYLRLVGQEQPRLYQDRGHFFAAAAQAMRRILIDNARRKQTEKRGGAGSASRSKPWWRRRPTRSCWPSTRRWRSWPADPLKARLVELRYVAGLTGEQAALVLGISPSTADRHRAQRQYCWSSSLTVRSGAGPAAAWTG